MEKIFGNFQVSGEKATFASLKRAFGKAFTVSDKQGTYRAYEDYRTLDILLDTLIANQQVLRKCKIDKIVIFIFLYYKNQCNWEVSPEQIKKLNFTGATLAITAYKVK